MLAEAQPHLVQSRPTPEELHEVSTLIVATVTGLQQQVHDGQQQGRRRERAPAPASASPWRARR
eukprot:2300947-Prorocentrum_lima.AAC.1